jgi:DNA-binding NarL/FixJ family response regulator
VVEAVLDHAPDILLFEVDRQAGPAAGTLRILRKMRPDLRVIVMSQDSRPEDADIVEAGAFYYDTKPGGEELVALVKAAARSPRSGRS